MEDVRNLFLHQRALDRCFDTNPDEREFTKNRRQKDFASAKHHIRTPSYTHRPNRTIVNVK